MAVASVDGTVESFELKRRTPSVSVYRDLVIRHHDGGETRLAKAIAARKVADLLNEGARGRFYLFESIDRRGIHGVRLDDGTKIHAYPAMNEKIILLVLVLNCFLLIARIAIEGVIWPLPLALIILAAIAYSLYRRTHIEAREQFEADQSASAR